MAYPSFPDPTSIRTGSTSGSITLDLHTPTHVTPNDVDTWLKANRWHSPCTDPDSGEVLYQKHSTPECNGAYFRWYEAVAYECYRFLSIGGE